MNLINEEISHEVFGQGNIVEHEGAIVTVEFNQAVKKFVYPDALGKFITLTDRETAESLKKFFLKKEEEKEALKKQQEEERERQAFKQQRLNDLKNNKIHGSSQIVFWLDKEEKENVFVDWQVFTGEVQSGENKGQPNRAVRLRSNSASLLTSRRSDQPETERRIQGLYMVEETFSGNRNDEGIVPSHVDYRIEFTDEEAEKMLFWNYYINKNHPHRMTWNSGKFRYLDNICIAQILKDLIAFRTDESQIKEATDFLEYFCQMNALDRNAIPQVNGALKQS